MEIPALPTDNLYKFLTLFGLALMIAGVALPVHEEHYYTEVGREMFGKTIAVLAEAFVAYPQGGTAEKADADAKAFTSGMEQMRTIIHAGVQMSESAERIRRYRTIGVILVVVGLGLSAFGFWLWYDRHQKYQDRILVRKSRLLNPGTEQA